MLEGETTAIAAKTWFVAKENARTSTEKTRPAPSTNFLICVTFFFTLFFIPITVYYVKQKIASIRQQQTKLQF
jgi:hypothetical protein